jgi:serine/threonine protein kinase
MSTSNDYLSARLSKGGDIQFLPNAFASGGMKDVHRASNAKLVVAFYRGPIDEIEWESRLLDVINKYNPTLTTQKNHLYWGNLFCWPIDICRHPEKGLGIVLPYYPENYFFRLGGCKDKEKDGGWFNCKHPQTNKLLRYSIVDPAERGNLRGYLSSLISVCRAVNRLHAAGLAHSDLSDKNVLIDPVLGTAILIDLDALIVKGLIIPGVLGTPRFIAPEVLATRHLSLTDPLKELPSENTDRHALAVLIYYYLLERHPLMGRRNFKGLSAEQENDAEFGIEALYSEHPSDESNKPADSYFPSSILGPVISNAFKLTFVNCLQRDFHNRPSASTWASLLESALDRCVPCPNSECTHKWFILIDIHNPICPYCNSVYKGWLFKIVFDRPRQPGWHDLISELVLQSCIGEETEIFPFHVSHSEPRGPGQESQPLARIRNNSSFPSGFGIENVSAVDMIVSHYGVGSPLSTKILIGQQIELVKDLRIQFRAPSQAILRARVVGVFHA